MGTPPVLRRLVLVRHAEAGAAVVDRDRPLTERGMRQAEAAGAWLARKGVVPDRVLVSPARRTLQTWDRVRVALPTAPERVVDERIYDNTVEGLFELVRETDEVQGLVLVGHNPAVAQLVGVLDDGAGSEPARGRRVGGFPPASIALFDVGTPFSVLGPGSATLVDLVVFRD
jgi:phosphohistidine phosphatase